MGQEQSSLGQPLKTIKWGTLYERDILLRNVFVRDPTHQDRLMYLIEQRPKDGAFLKIHRISSEGNGIFCGGQMAFQVAIEFYDWDLAAELRKRRIKSDYFQESEIIRNIDNLIDGLAKFQKLGVLYTGLSTLTLIYHNGIKLLDPYIFDLPKQVRPVYINDAPENLYARLVWSLGIIILEMATLQIIEQFQRSMLEKIQIPYLTRVLNLIFATRTPDFIELQSQLRQIEQATDYAKSGQQVRQSQYQSLPTTVAAQEFSLDLKRIPVDTPVKASRKSSLTDRITLLKREYYSGKQDKASITQVDLRSDPFLIDHDLNSLSIKSPYVTQKESYVSENFTDGSLYEGYKIDDKRHGQGSMHYADGSFYIGQWQNDLMYGFGSLYHANGTLAYQGFWVDDTFHGKGILFNDQPQECSQVNFHNFNSIGSSWVSYSGDFVKNQKHGFGVLVFTTGERFEGRFKDDLIYGQGIFKGLSGDVKGFWNLNLLR